MIIDDLVRYYDAKRLECPEALPRPGWTLRSPVACALIDEQGNLLEVRLEQPAAREMPEQPKRSSNISPFFLSDSVPYVFGAPGGKKEGGSRGEACLKAASELYGQILDGVESPVAKALLAYYEKRSRLGPVELDMGPQDAEALNMGQVSFRVLVDGVELEAEKDPQVGRAWDAYLEGRQERQGRCCATGQQGPMASIHPALRRIRSAGPTGASLVSFGKQSTPHYGMSEATQCSPVGARATHAYVSALQYLIDSPVHSGYISGGQTTYVWFFDRDDQECSACLGRIIGARHPVAPAAAAQPPHPSETRFDPREIPEGADLDARYHLLGLRASSARVATVLSLSGTLASAVAGAALHREQALMASGRELWSATPQKVAFLTSDPRSNRVVPADPVVDEIVRAVLEGKPYPEQLLGMLLDRACSSGGGDRKLSDFAVASALKAFLVRNRGVGLCARLDHSCRRPSYLAGRLYGLICRAYEVFGPEGSAMMAPFSISLALANPAFALPSLAKRAVVYMRRRVADYPAAAIAISRDIEQMLDTVALPENLHAEERADFFVAQHQQRQELRPELP